jgi:DNA repair exonuclease SbcCD ATPase subunit
MMRNVVFAALAGASLAVPSPIRKVITLIEEMKANVEKEGKEDLKAYDEYKCWCDTNGAEKKEAIAYATEQIADLEAFLQEAAGKEGELKSEIAGLSDDISEDNSALGTATSVREKESEEFAAMEADSKESIGLLTQAIDVLTKAQTLAQTGKSSAGTQAALIQVRNVVSKHFPQFKGIMQKDLFDMMGSFQEIANEQQEMSRSAVVTGAFLGEVFLPKREAAALEQSEEKAPISGGGAAAGAKSYDSKGGQIIGILSEMKDEMVRDLSAAQKTEFKALVDFQSLRAAKLAEIQASTKQKDMKEAALADLLDRAAKAAEDIEATKNARSADEKFVAEMTENCKVVDQEYATRTKIRGEEIVALGETLDILTSDDARDLFAKSVGTSFLQVDQQSSRQDRAMQHIAKVAKKHNNWALLSLAVRVRLDAFTKVKAAMDKMLAELKAQQKNDYEKNEQCKTDLDTTEDNIKVAEREKKDLAEKNKDLSNTIDTLTEEIKTLKQEVADMEVSLKKAGIDRKAENELYQQNVADQRATVKVLNMALDRMKEFYSPSLVQIHSHQPVPGAAAAPPPPKPKAYEKSGGSGGVMQLLTMIIEEATREEQELQKDENQAQKMYGEFVTATKTSIEADRASIAEKEKQLAETESALSATKESQLANEAKIEDLNNLLAGFHADCDYIIKYFKIRQQFRQEEIDSIEEAKAILSGADFGK